MILPRDAYRQWIDPELADPAKAHAMIGAFALDDMTAYPVGLTVNNPRNETRACIELAEGGRAEEP